MSKATFVSELRWFMSGSNRYFEAIPAGNYILSIQASEGHYCFPKENLPPEEYSSFELAIWHKDSQHFLNAAKSSVFRSFPRWDDLKSCASNSIFGWVHTDLLQELINYLKTK